MLAEQRNKRISKKTWKKYGEWLRNTDLHPERDSMQPDRSLVISQFAAGCVRDERVSYAAVILGQKGDRKDTWVVSTLTGQDAKGKRPKDYSLVFIERLYRSKKSRRAFDPVGKRLGNALEMTYQAFGAVTYSTEGAGSPLDDLSWIGSISHKVEVG